MRGTRWLAVVALVGAATLIAGCGGGGGTLSKAQYEQRVQADGKALEKAISAMSSTSSSSVDSLTKALTSAREGLKKAASDLEALKPPKEAEAANAAFAAALRAVEGQLGAMQQALTKKDMAAVATVVQKLSTSKEIAAAQKAATELKNKGYDLGALGG